jgi:hypothetical protein
VLTEFQLAGDDFLNDPVLGPQLKDIDKYATSMLTFASDRYREVHGQAEQMQRLLSRAQQLNAVAVKFLDETAHLVIYDE